MEANTRFTAALTAAVLLLCYASTLRGMYLQWMNDEDMSHGVLVPAVALWVVWRERAVWRSRPAEPSGLGWVLLAMGAGLHLAGVLGGGLFASSVAFLLSLIGAIVCLGGWVRLRQWAFPLLLLVFMLPKLAFVYNQVTLPLQLLASRLAAFLLASTGFGVIRSGNILEVGGRSIAVAEACNGIRFLLPLGFVAVLLGDLTRSKVWTRLALVLTAVPLAILANGVRVAAAGAVPALSDGTPHLVSGWIIFAACIAVFLLTAWLFDTLESRFHA